MPSNRCSCSLLASLCVGAVLIACDGNSTAPKGAAGIRVLFGADIADTVDAIPSQALVVEVRDEDGQLAPRVVVRFESQPPTDSTRRNQVAVSVCALTAPVCTGSTFRSDSTDSRGRVSVLTRLGVVAGRAVIRISAPQLGLVDSASFTVAPGKVARVRAPAADTGIDVGASITLRGRAVDRYENAVTSALTTSLGVGSALTLNAATSTVTAVSMGTQYVVYRFGTLADSTRVRAMPAGRLVVWSAPAQAVRMVDLNGNNLRTLATSISSDYGVFPQFDNTRQRVTMHGGLSGSGQPNVAIVVDTASGERRNVTAGLATIIAVRGLSDGALAIVGRRDTDTGYSLFRVGLDNSLTLVVGLPGFNPAGNGYGGADISHDGTRVVYLNGVEVRILNAATGTTTILASNGRCPRWSALDDRIAYISPTNGFDGMISIVNADGSGARTVSSIIFSPGITWSPDGQYLVARASGPASLQLLRVLDGTAISLRTSAGALSEDFYQPDWR